MKFVQPHLSEQASSDLAEMTDSAASAWLGVAALQRVNQHSAQRSALRWHQAAARLRDSRAVTELVGVQSSLMLGYLQEWTLYLQEMGFATVRLQDHLKNGQESMHASSRSAAFSGPNSALHALDAALAAAEASNTATLAALQSWSDLVVDAAGPASSQIHRRPQAPLLEAPRGKQG